MDQSAEQVMTQPYEPYQPRSISRKTAYPELTDEVAMVGAPLDTTRADRGGAAAPLDRGGVLRRFLGSAGRPRSVNDTAADHGHTADVAQTATFSTDADGQAWTPPTREEIVSTHSGPGYPPADPLPGHPHHPPDPTPEG